VGGAFFVGVVAVFGGGGFWWWGERGRKGLGTLASMKLFRWLQKSEIKRIPQRKINAFLIWSSAMEELVQRACSMLQLSNVKPEQIKALKKIIEHDVFIVLPAG